MMQVFNLKEMTSYPYEERDRNVFYKAEEFKARIIELPPGGEMPTCDMASYVIFYVIDELMADGDRSKLLNFFKKRIQLSFPH